MGSGEVRECKPFYPSHAKLVIYLAEVKQINLGVSCGMAHLKTQELLPCNVPHKSETWSAAKTCVP